MFASLNKRQKKTLANIIIAACILCGLGWIASLFIHLGGEYTNNAQVRQDIVPVLSRVQGFLKKVNFDEFQYVHKDDVLAEIEDSEFALRLAQAQADCRELEIQFWNAKAEYQRYKNLLKNEAATPQQFDAVKTRYKSLKEKLRRQEEEGGSSVGLCKAAVDLARLNLSYTVIKAPCDGYTSRKTVQEGELVMPGSKIVSIVDSKDKWIVAHYRETQMRHIRVGSKVDVRIDAFPSARLEGVVTAVSGATGAQFSVVPTDNSIGNFVKVESRISVKINFTENNDPAVIEKLSAGMNAECTVRKK